MPISTTTIFTCNRDGVTAEGTGGENASTVNLPEGWGRFNCDEALAEGGGFFAVTSYLCPQCLAALRDWMAAEGGTGLPAPPPSAS